MNIYRSIDEWLKDNYTPLNNWIYFNATPEIVGAVAMNSVPGDNIRRRFIDGTKEREVLFAIDMIDNYDATGTSDINMTALDEVNNFIEWLDTQKKEKNYPDFGEFTDITEMEVLTNTPSLLVNTQTMLSKYQFQCRIIYKDYKEVKF